MQRFHHDENESCGCGHGGPGHGGPGHGHGGPKPPFGMGGHMRGGFGAMIAQRMRRGDVRTAILRLLAEKPMHGYQIIQELSARSGGAWSPSAGSVYPTLQLLADEDLVVAEETGGKKVFALTDAGKAAVAAIADQSAPWEDAAESDSGAHDYRQAAAKLMHAVMQIGKGGSADQVERAVAVLTEARKELYKILAED
jgi:DNA-binding PadR family transcriptional regulator